MKKTVMMGLVGFVLGTAVAVGAATLGSEEAVAAPCCWHCEGYYETCSPQCNGDATCEKACMDEQNRCYRICNPAC